MTFLLGPLLGSEPQLVSSRQPGAGEGDAQGSPHAWDPRARSAQHKQRPLSAREPGLPPQGEVDALSSYQHLKSVRVRGCSSGAGLGGSEPRGPSPGVRSQEDRNARVRWAASHITPPGGAHRAGEVPGTGLQQGSAQRVPRDTGSHHPQGGRSLSTPDPGALPQDASPCLATS